MFSFVRPFVEGLCRLWALLPRKVIRVLGAGIGVLWIDILRFRRRVVLDNLRLCFPDWSEEKRVAVGRESLRRQGSNFAEVFTLPGRSRPWFERNVVYEGWEHLENARAEGRGVYLLGMHVGNGDMTAAALSARGVPLFLISKFFSHKFSNDLWFHIRGRFGTRYIEPHGEKTAFEILRAVREKGCVAFVLDQFMGRPFGIPTRFFGRETGTAYGLALFVLKTGSPVVPVYSYEGEDDKIHIVCEPRLELSSLVGDDKDENLRRMTQRFNDVIESVVRRHPKEWMWVHRRWKEYE